MKELAWPQAFTKNETCQLIREAREMGMEPVPMFTTWHTLRDKMPTILDCARKCGMARFVWDEHSGHIQETAVMLRRVSFEGNSYEDCGWAKEQIDV